MVKLRKNEIGFSIVEVLLIIVVVVVVSGIGYFVYSRKGITSPKKTTIKSTKSTAAAKPVFSTLPTGWVNDDDDTIGLRMGYPEAWVGSDDTSQDAKQYSDSSKNLMGSMVSINTPKNSADFSVIANKYGATIKPSSDGKSWVVSDENPAAVDDYKVGDTYKTKVIKVTGGTAIDLSYSEEDCTLSRWVIVLKNTYETISIPSLCNVNGVAVSAANKAAYTKLVAEFLGTITVY